MPIYEYRRQDGSTFEVIQKFSDDALTTDPETGEPVERVYSAPAIHFKGSGFHNTDYGSRRRAKADSGDAGSSSSDGGGDGGAAGGSSGNSESKSSDTSSSDSSSSASSQTASKSSASPSSD